MCRPPKLAIMYCRYLVGEACVPGPDYPQLIAADRRPVTRLLSVKAPRPQEPAADPENHAANNGFAVAVDKGQALWLLNTPTINKVGARTPGAGSASSITGCRRVSRRRGRPPGKR